MRILVVSDTHGHGELLGEALRQVGKINWLLHLGDGERDCDLLSAFDGQILRVRGNCDIASGEPEERLLSLPGAIVYMTHGHLLDAKHTLYRLWARGKEREADLVCFGHTHKSLHDRQGKLTLLNPGSLRFGHSYAVVDLIQGGMKIKLCKLR